MARPDDEMMAGAGGRGHMRASHADREQAIDMLKAAFVQGRLTKDELDVRVGRALASLTYADLAAATAGIPAGLTEAQRPETARTPANRDAITAVACVSAAWTSIWIPLLIVDGVRSAASLVLMLVLISVVPGSLTGFLLFHAWLDERAGRRSSHGPPPGAGGGASRRRAPAGPAGQLPRTSRNPRRATEAAPAPRCQLPPSWRLPPRLLAAGSGIRA